MKRTTPLPTVPIENDNNNNQCQIIGKHGRHKGQFSNPQDVLILSNPTKTLLVSDTINQNVQLFSLETGVYTGIFAPSSTSRQTPLRRPIGLSNTFNDNSACFVADYDQHLISTWSIDENGNGKLIKKFGQQSLIGPKGLCVSNQSQRIVVADNKANNICLFDSSGVFLHRFGKRGRELDELAGPHYVKFAEQDNDRTVIITDFYNNAVKIFDIERQGQFVTSFGSVGTKNGLFQAPTGLAIDYERGYIFVSDWGNNRIQIFDRQGTFIRIIELSSSDMLYGPQGLDYDPIGHTLAIANSGKHSALLVHID
jgi:DNA-binding beta-propeller fold protein YncE